MAMIIIVVLHFEMRVSWLNCKAEYISEQIHCAIWCGINQITITLAHTCINFPGYLTTYFGFKISTNGIICITCINA